MRLIYTSSDQNRTQELSAFLAREGIENQCEIETNHDWGSSNYGDLNCSIWIIDEDQVEKAQRWVTEYETHPQNPIFTHVPKQAPLFTPPTRRKGVKGAVPFEKGFKPLTVTILLICSLLFLLGQFTLPTEEPSFAPLLHPTPLLTPPIYKVFLYDYPHAFDLLDQLILLERFNPMQNGTTLSPEGQLLLNQYLHTPYWQGIYQQLIPHISHPSAAWNFTAPLFEKIREGEIWRLVTPIFLHANLLHLFFNSLWWIILGTLIEERLGIPRTLFFIILVAAFSNTAQYLMSGPNFVGISGVVIGMLGFIWSRQRVAPWEGYRLASGTFSFMLLFILGVALIQLFAFLQEAMGYQASFPSIANTAHICGGIAGILLGRLDFFRMRKVIP